MRLARYAEPALLRTTWQETPRPAPCQQRSGAALHHGTSASTADGAQAAADLIGAGAAGLAAAQAFRSQLPQDAAEYVRLNVLPRPGQPQPPPQIIGRPSDVERLLDEAGQRAQKVERGAAQAIEETAAVAPEEGAWAEPSGTWQALAPTAGEVAGTLAGAAGVGAAATAGLPAAQPRPGPRHGLGAGEHALPASAGQRGRGRAGRPVRQQHERRHAASALHAAQRQQHVRQPRKQPRLLAVSLPCSGAVQHAAPALPQLQFRAVTPEPASAQL